MGTPLRAWPNLRQQHDVAEFWGYLLSRAEPTSMAGTTGSPGNDAPEIMPCDGHQSLWTSLATTQPYKP